MNLKHGLRRDRPYYRQCTTPSRMVSVLDREDDFMALGVVGSITCRLWDDVSIGEIGRPLRTQLWEIQMGSRTQNFSHLSELITEYVIKTSK
ncbi:hypothetical protein RB195_021750 [Necator americanus]|uniref:Uncharacterized protein n=1 Tax=Necator americanus TaxID=51031 RepID=A0ABR1ECH8_NECAM